MPGGSAGSGTRQFNLPYGVRVDSTGNVYVADSRNGRIQEFDSSGTYLTQWGSSGSGTGQFNGPSGVAVDSTGHIYVADTFNRRIQEFGYQAGGGGGGGADLVLSQAAAPPYGAKVGGTVTFQVKVTNTGPDTATGVRLAATLSGVGVTVRTEGRCGPVVGSVVTCDLGTLPNHASRVVTISAKPTAAGVLTSIATVTSSSTDPGPGNNTAPTLVTVTSR